MTQEPFEYLPLGVLQVLPGSLQQLLLEVEGFVGADAGLGRETGLPSRVVDEARKTLNEEVEVVRELVLPVVVQGFEVGGDGLDQNSVTDGVDQVLEGDRKGR